jgi:endonuclease/exonuclease/phosphatase family metal-dependent hydrolase
MRLATFNIENMFERASAMNLPWEEGRQVLLDFTRLSNLIQKQQYSQNDKDNMLDIMKRHRGLLNTGESRYIRLIETRGRLTDTTHTKIQVNRRVDWIGWFELKRETIKEEASENRSRVICVVNADVLCILEVESRDAMNRFNDSVIAKLGQKYDHVRLGGDNVGVGVMTRYSFYIESEKSHIDDTDEKGKIFNGDCIEYEIMTPGNKLLVIINHFRSRYDSPAQNDINIKRQAKRVRDIYEERLNQGFEFIAIAGDLNNTPEREPLKPLLGDGSNLVDIMQHHKFTGDRREGTYGNGTKNDKLDYILMSPQISSRVKAGGIERRGVWGGKNGDLFPHFPEIKTAKDAASDHAALWVDLDL